MIPEGMDCSGFNAYYRNADGEYVPLDYMFSEMVLPPTSAYPPITDVIGDITAVAGMEFTAHFKAVRGRRAKRAWRRSMRMLRQMLITKEVLV